MAQLTLDIPDAVVPRLLDALGYSGPPNAAQQRQFVKNEIIGFLRMRLKDYEGNSEAEVAATTARETRSAEIDTIAFA
jgi:hypothetical protein